MNLDVPEFTTGFRIYLGFEIYYGFSESGIIENDFHLIISFDMFSRFFFSLSQAQASISGSSGSWGEYRGGGNERSLGQISSVC